MCPSAIASMTAKASPSSQGWHRGNGTLLIHGARAVIRVAERKASYAQSWLAQLIGRRNKNVAAVALANKNARIVWALLAHERDYQSGYEPKFLC